jgi:hypothetical protein
MSSFTSLLPWHTIVFCSLIIIICVWDHIKFSAKIVSYAPSILTTIGIGATFFGLSIGLWEFDANNIQGSIPALLGGLKTAFFASATGVAAALSIKLRYRMWGLPLSQKNADVHDATIDDLVKEMIGVQQSLVGNDDSTLLSQMKLSRQDFNDRLDALKKSQHDFMEKMADNNSKALIEALEKVMRDFNTKINEQFGDNFKQLNSAVEKILGWQELYRQQMTEMIQQQTQSAENMTKATESFTTILEKTKDFQFIAENLSSLLGAINSQRNQMEQSLKSLGELLTKASGSLPEVENKIIELTQQVTNGVKTNHDEITKILRDSSLALQSAVENLRKSMSDVLQNTNQDFNSHITTITNKTKEQVAALDIALQEELTKSLDGLARQLTALSQQFVADYTPLTERLREVVSLARKT